jgi:hypothetical protein
MLHNRYDYDELLLPEMDVDNQRHKIGPGRRTNHNGVAFRYRPLDFLP